MSEEEQAWERQENEPLLWFRRFDRYRLMRPVRNVALVFQMEETERNREKPRTSPTGNWYEIAKQWQWEARAAAYDAHLRAMEEAEVERIMHEGYAMVHERVKALNKQAHGMEEPYISPDTGRTYFLRNSPEHMREWRGLLDDLAQETGGRVKKKEVTGKDGAPLNVTIWIPDNSRDGYAKQEGDK